MSDRRAALAWGVVALAILAPITFAAFSPQLQWRGPVYIFAGFAGIVGMALLLAQPLLIARRPPGFTAQRARRLHRQIGGGIVLAVVLHVAGLWIVSPPDVIDVLLFRSPTPFAVWGAIAMWAAFAAGALAALRGKLRLRARTWRRAHLALTATVVVGTIIHAVQIEGAMETVTKFGLAAILALATAWTAYRTLRR